MERPWSEGIFRFLERVWRLFEGNVVVGSSNRNTTSDGGNSTADRDLLRKLHLTIAKVTSDIERFHFNTAVSATMELSNAMQDYRQAHGEKNPGVLGICYEPTVVASAYGTSHH